MDRQTLRETQRFLLEARADLANVREAVRLAHQELTRAKAELLTAQDALALVRAQAPVGAEDEQTFE